MALLAWLPRQHPRARAPVHELPPADALFCFESIGRDELVDGATVVAVTGSRSLNSATATRPGAKCEHSEQRDDLCQHIRPPGAILAVSAAAPMSDYGYFVFWAPTKARPLGPTPLTWMTTASRTSTKCGRLAGSV